MLRLFAAGSILFSCLTVNMALAEESQNHRPGSLEYYLERIPKCVYGYFIRRVDSIQGAGIAIYLINQVNLRDPSNTNSACPSNATYFGGVILGSVSYYGADADRIEELAKKHDLTIYNK